MKIADFTSNDFDLFEEMELDLIKGGRVKDFVEKTEADHRSISQESNPFYMRGYR
ncbi:MAG: hypothetical protein E6772_17915 [Dysgonomonas sp.]|nr:hypothetical protein [Dysgonomonas sp.]